MPILPNLEKDKRLSESTGTPSEGGLKESQQLTQTSVSREVYYFEPPPAIRVKNEQRISILSQYSSMKSIFFSFFK